MAISTKKKEDDAASQKESQSRPSEEGSYHKKKKSDASKKRKHATSKKRKNKELPEHDVPESPPQEEHRTPSTSARPQERITHRQRINMDGSVSHIDAVNSDSPPSPSKQSKKRDMIVIEDPELAKKIAKYIAKKERKRKRQERFRQDPAKLLNQFNASSDSLGERSKSTIENLYGPVARNGKMSGDQSEASISVTSVPNAVSQMDKSNDDIGDTLIDDDDDDRWEEDLVDQSERSNRSTTTENDELLKAAASALERYQLAFASSRSMSDDSLDEIGEEAELKVDGTATSGAQQHAGHGNQRAVGFHDSGIIVDKNVVKEFVENLENEVRDDEDSAVVENVATQPNAQVEMKNKRRSSKGEKNRKSGSVPMDVNGTCQENPLIEINKAPERSNFPPRQIDLDPTKLENIMYVDLSMDTAFEEKEEPINDNLLPTAHEEAVQFQPSKARAKSTGEIERTQRAICSQTSTTRHVENDFFVNQADDGPRELGETTKDAPMVRTGQRRRRRVLYGFLAAFVVMGIAGLVCWIILRDGRIAQGDDPEPPPTTTPVQSIATYGPTTSSFASASSAILEEFGQATFDLSKQTNSAQAEAARWISFEDTYFTFPLANNSLTKEAFRQRYVMAVFFFSTGGRQSWRETFNFLSPDQECKWAHDDVVSCLSDSVTGLTIPNNGLSSSLPEEIWALKELQRLDLSDNAISGSLPDGLYRLSRLESLSLVSNALVGSISSSIGDLQNLEILEIKGSFIIGTLPPQISNLPSLRNLVLSEGGWTGTIPTDIITLSALRVLDLSFNDLDGTIPTQVASMPRLERADLSNNRLEGRIPPGNYPALEEFSANSNRLSGQVPSFLLVNTLQVLSLRNNRFSGNLPLVWFAAPLLSFIDLSETGLSGSLPATLGTLTDLNTLILSNCGLTGRLPSELSNTAIERLELDGNRLEGTVPQTYSGLPLAVFTVEDNLLTGDISSTICSISTLRTASADCNVLCPCCSRCF